MVMGQLKASHRSKFPATLTRKFAIDNSLVTALNERGLGNSATQFQLKVLEAHIQRHLQAMRECE